MRELPQISEAEFEVMKCTLYRVFHKNHTSAV